MDKLGTTIKDLCFGEINWQVEEMVVKKLSLKIKFDKIIEKLNASFTNKTIKTMNVAYQINRFM